MFSAHLALASETAASFRRFGINDLEAALTDRLVSEAAYRVAGPTRVHRLAAKLVWQ